MARNDYRAMLSKRMEKEFSSWFDQEHIHERDLYRFLHTIKGTAGTIGMDDMSSFCSSQLENLSETSSALIPVRSLKNFILLMRNFFRGEEEAAILEVEQIEEVPVSIEENSSFILMIDDDVEFASFMKETLEENGVQVVIALTGKRGVELFYTLQPHMVIVDVQLPDMNGFDILTQIGDIARSLYVPVTLISVDGRIENQIRAFEMGAMDFIPKPLDMTVFVPYILNRLKHKLAIWQSALTDELTGAGNRRQFTQTLSQISALAERKRYTYTLVMLDLDYFKKVNDQYGHPAGDNVLRSFSSLVLKMKRETDYFFRYGGEEFALILVDTTPQEAVILIERIRSKMADISFNVPSFDPFHVTFSAGASEYRIDEATVLNEADQALYKAKRNGRNQTIIYEIDSGDVKRHLNIMIVDDDLLVRKMLWKQFSGWKPNEIDVAVHEYPDGISFLESNWYKPDENYMILLDGIMPKMDGLEVLTNVRKRFPDDNIVISMLTARTNEADIVLALKSGADDYIVKPFHPQEVVARVQRLTKRMFK
ncbi:GGDEF domain-containing response regulator [Domibacillus iocasae]|uniref:Diguanylate cyclase n=1 Tax=Domibacillus iocasae TaxID=1714016 RepID=A0A1E7DUD9_9BACI|nr:diguanylate cyclase [Domibacillus iocasae]OES46700.1 diguanylate cyclase [Domibacillus iocasae]